MVARSASISSSSFFQIDSSSSPSHCVHAECAPRAMWCRVMSAIFHPRGVGR